MTGISALLLERIATPTGPMLIVTDDEGHLRALDWEEHEARMQGLLRRHYGADAARLRATPHPSTARRALEAYFDGDMESIARVPTATNGTACGRVGVLPSL